MIYFDYAASSPPFPEVISRVSNVSETVFGNPGALHSAGAEARKILQESRRILAQRIGVRPEEIFFTSGGTEANNWAVRIGSALNGRKHIVCSSSEHSSVLESVRKMEKKGYCVTYLSPDHCGLLRPEAVEAALRPDTGLLCIQAINNETGVVQDVDALSRIARKHRVLYFCDAVQSFGHADQCLHRASLISISAHKLGGPRGVGCLVIRQPLAASPMILGGGQEFGCRSGTENIPGIAGFALAAELSCRELAYEQARLDTLRQLLEQQLRQACPLLEIAGGDAPRGHILCCRFPGISAEEMVVRLDANGICTSPGAACAARSGAPSHVLLSMGYPAKDAWEFLRFSLGRNTTEAEIRHTANIITDILRKKERSQ